MPNSIVIPYVDEKSEVFKTIRRPKLDLSFYSKNLKCWIKIENILADTGADISVLPRSLGLLLLGDYKNGVKYKISGLTPKSVDHMYIQKLSVKLGNKKFRTDFAISNSDSVPPTLGRLGALDKFDVIYKKGRSLVISWD